MQYIIDRFEEHSAVCEDENQNFSSFPLSLLPPGVKEGDVLDETEGVFTLNPEETARRRKAVSGKLRGLFKH